MPQNRITRALHLLTLLLAAFPLFVMVAFFAYVIRARLYLGHWPSYNHPDPKQLGWWIQHSLLQLGFVGFPFASLLAVVSAIVGRVRSREFPFWTIIITIIVASAVLIAFTLIDPGGFVDWFWD
jgi:hypothetical protein